MLTIGIFGPMILTCRKPGRKILHRKNMQVLIILLLSIQRETVILHDRAYEPNICGQIHLAIDEEMTVPIML